jgi:2-polyprenyl-3-methyl-5-hydroxy-6-metoxy-1,4-benzoquinol methylase
MDSLLQLEADAFDNRVLERIKNGLIPDLRRAEPNDWFFNNPWRRPLFVDMVFGDYFRFINSNLKPGSKVLEVGSGLGQITLELARAGHHVTGLELSGASVGVANKYKDENPYQDNFGSLQYIHSDFLSYETDEKYDAVYFCLTLHHFSNLGEIIQKCKVLLKPDGKIIVVEPARDLFSKRNASIVALLRLMLSINNNWFKGLELPVTTADLDGYVDDCLNEYRDAKDKNEQEQSPNDNESYAEEMLRVLNSHFIQAKLEYGNTLVPRMIGGLRSSSEEKTVEMAKFLKLFDDYATKAGLIEPGVIFYIGTLK